MHTIIMPKMGDAMEEGTLVRWLKQEGDAVREGEPIAEIATDKATVEIEAPSAGVLKGISVQEGMVVPVNTPLAYILQAGERLPSEADGAAVPAPAPVPAPAAALSAAAPASAPAAHDGEMRVLASPLARKIAAEHGVDLEHIRGTGPNGRIVVRDVLAYLEAQKAATPVPAAAPFAAPAPSVAESEGHQESLSRVRLITAQRTTEAHQTIPHFYLTMEIDMENALALRAQLNQLDENLHVSVNDLIVRACAVALQQHPVINARYQNGQLIHPDGIHIGVAVAVEQGLLVAVLKHCEGKSLRWIAREVRTLIQKARDGKLMPDELVGNTFTVSNLGMFGVEQFTAIINPPASAILAVGATRRVPVVNDDGSITPRQRMKVTMSCDHRVIDGAVGAQFLQTLKQTLENPLLML